MTEGIVTTNNEGIICINLNEDDTFYKCKHGYMFADINYNLYQRACRRNCLEVTLNCKDCKYFEEKKED